MWLVLNSGWVCGGVLVRCLRHSLAQVSTKASRVVKPLNGQVALVTGGARGVGRGIALELSDAGATVYVTGRKPGPATGKPTLNDTVEGRFSSSVNVIFVFVYNL
ncbi:unnamed protein product [Gongylonema pulchrum]|uniref:Dehydrogenase/reductase SDR family member 4 n=1 Tax=Gongylonema pulchrum TaxID=637853 RepID=A0A183EYQ0_9BILA|nr:unnamed protein product [Gongylonema pulchrum]